MDEVPPILVVDDEPLVRLTITEALEQSGYNVIEAADGRTAVELIDQVGQLRGLVTDIRMGASPDGWEVAHHARDRFAALAVVYVTGDSITEWPANGVPQSTVLQKPFPSAELMTALANLLVAQQSNAPQS
jgi:CheY-like chemotaxis protein